MTHTDDISSWYESLDEIKEDGLVAVKALNIYSLFKMKGKTSKITLDNIESYSGQYLLHSPKENRYYIKTYKEYSYTEFMDLVHDGSDTYINDLVNKISDGNIYLLFTYDMVSDMKTMLSRVYKGTLSGEGTLQYKTFLKLLELTIKLEEYKSYGRELRSFKTVCNILQEDIDAVWKKAHELINVKP